MKRMFKSIEPLYKAVIKPSISGGKMAATSEQISHNIMSSNEDKVHVVEDVEIIEVPNSNQSSSANEQDQPKSQTQFEQQQPQPYATPSKTPSNAQIEIHSSSDNTTPSRDPKSGNNSVTTTPARLSKQKQKEEEKIARMKQRELERLEREKAREAERLLKEKKRLEKEEERRKANEEKERIKREKREQLQREKEEREKEKQEEKRKKEEEKQKKEEEKLKAEEEKKKAEEEKLKKASKLQISNFFKPKSVVKSTTITNIPISEAADAEYKKSFHAFYVRENVFLHKVPTRCAFDEFDKQMKAPDDKVGELTFTKHKKQHDSTTAKYIFSNQLDAAPLNMKFIRFYENIKTYIGSYTKEVSKDLAKNPFIFCETPFIDWEDEQEEDEEGEGEDIDDDDEEEDEEDEGMEDLSDFLDEEEDKGISKKRAAGPLIPQVSWRNIDSFKVEILKENITSVDPFYNYWDDITTPDASGHVESSPKPKKAKSLITNKDDLEKFAKEVNDSDFTVPTMVELLKKQLPNYTKLTIENTLKNYAKKVGPKATEKKWEVDRELLGKAMGT